MKFTESANEFCVNLGRCWNEYYYFVHVSGGYDKTKDQILNEYFTNHCKRETNSGPLSVVNGEFISDSVFIVNYMVDSSD
jgi:hypothetical protein